MPQAMLEFNLPADEHDFEAASRASAIVATVREFDNVMRGILKYDQNASEEFLNGVSWCRDTLWQHLRDARVAELFE